MADAALYRQIVDVLLAEHEASTPPRPQDETMARKLGVTWGLYCHGRFKIVLGSRLAVPGGCEVAFCRDQVSVRRT